MERLIRLEESMKALNDRFVVHDNDDKNWQNKALARDEKMTDVLTKILITLGEMKAKDSQQDETLKEIKDSIEKLNDKNDSLKSKLYKVGIPSSVGGGTAFIVIEIIRNMI